MLQYHLILRATCEIIIMYMHVCYRCWGVPQWPSQLLSSVCRIKRRISMRLFCWISLASRQKNLHRSARCILYINVHHAAFTDIDECLQGTAGCNHDCRNTEGSFICTCYDGYQLHHNDLTTCVGMSLKTVWYVYSYNFISNFLRCQ